MLFKRCREHFTPANLYIGALFLLSFFVARLGAPVWYDEMATWWAVQPAYPWQVVEFLIQAKEPFPPLYFLLVHLFKTLFGDSILVLRLPSLIAGSASLIVLYLFGKKFISKSAGLLAATIAFFAWSRLLFSVDARPYALIFLTSSLFAWAYWNFVSKPPDEKPTRREGLFLFASAVVLSYLHFFGLMLVGIAGLHALIRVPRARKILVGAGLAFLPWLPFMLLHLIHAPTNQNIPYREPLRVLKRSLHFHLFDPELLESLPLDLMTYASNLLLLGCIFGIAYMLFRKRPLPRFDIYLLAWLFIPLALVILKSEISQPVYRAKYLMICSPALILILAKMLSLLWQKLWARPLVLLYLSGICWASFVASDFLHTNFFRTEKEVVQDLRGRFTEGTGLIICSHQSEPLRFYFQDDAEFMAAWPASWRCDQDSLREHLAKRTEEKLLLWMYMRDVGPEEVIPPNYRVISSERRGSSLVMEMTRNL